MEKVAKIKVTLTYSVLHEQRNYRLDDLYQKTTHYVRM